LDAFCSFGGQRENLADLVAEKDPKVIPEAVQLMSGFIPSVSYFKNFANIALFAIFCEATNGFFPSLLHKQSSLDVACLFFLNAPLLIPVTFCITFKNTGELC
jgi:hypothetical protein